MSYEQVMRAYGVDEQSIAACLAADNVQRFRNLEHDAYGQKPTTFDPPARDEVPATYADRRGF